MSFIAVAIGGGALIGGIASAVGSSQQAGAANNAANLQSTDAAKSLAEQQREFNINQQNQAPFLQAGQGAVTTLSGLIPQLNEAGANYPTFQAPTADQARQTPGYQFALQQGLQGVQNSAAARGGLLSGNAIAATEQYGQGLADTNYQQVYNNALGQYQQGYNQFQNQQANQFNRYAALAGVGQTAANQLGAQGQAAAQNVANINSTSGQQIGNSLQNSAAATASGYVGAGNAIGGGINNLSQYYLLSQLGVGGANPYGPNGINPESYPANYPYNG